jgi:membrane protease YdiL (CAAX protease family)
MSTAVINRSKAQSASPWWEVLVVMAASLGIGLVDARLKLVSILIPALYLIIERRLRKRTWTEMGFNIRSTPVELLRNFGWVLLVGVGTQALSVFGAKFLLPDYFAHVIARVPFDMSSLGAAVFVALAISTFGEEIIYRAFFQQRITAFLPVWAAIGLSSLVFALMHYAPGPALIVFVDLALVVVDSLIYGIIFARSNNVFVAWAAHFLADVVGMLLLLAMIQ